MCGLANRLFGGRRGNDLGAIVGSEELERMAVDLLVPRASARVEAHRDIERERKRGDLAGFVIRRAGHKKTLQGTPIACLFFSRFFFASGNPLLPLGNFRSHERSSMANRCDVASSALVIAASQAWIRAR